MAKKAATDKDKDKEATEKKTKGPSRRKAKAEAAVQSAAAAQHARASATYEAMFLFPPPGVVDVDGMLARARSIIESHGGKILFTKKWDERKLSYEIKHQKRGTFI